MWAGIIESEVGMRIKLDESRDVGNIYIYYTNIYIYIYIYRWGKKMIKRIPTDVSACVSKTITSNKQ